PNPGSSSASETDDPDIRLICGPDEFLLVNLSDEPVDVSDLVFQQTRADGFEHIFEAAEWDRYISESSAYLEAESCLQLLTAQAPPPAPDDRCPRLAGFFRSTVERRYFWRSSDADASFTVRLGAETLATCPIAAGECSFTLPAP